MVSSETPKWWANSSTLIWPLAQSRSVAAKPWSNDEPGAGASTRSAWVWVALPRDRHGTSGNFFLLITLRNSLS